MMKSVNSLENNKKTNSYKAGRLLAIIGVIAVIGAGILMKYVSNTYYKHAFAGFCIDGLIIGIALIIIGLILIKCKTKAVIIGIIIVFFITGVILPIQKHDGVGEYEYRSVIYDISLKYREASPDSSNGGYIRTIKVFGILISEHDIDDEEYYKSYY